MALEIIELNRNENFSKELNRNEKFSEELNRNEKTRTDTTLLLNS
jgi:hypothetical protein